jgi:hypothetical protein
MDSLVPNEHKIVNNKETMIIKIGLNEKNIMSISGYRYDNYGCCSLDNYENIS